MKLLTDPRNEYQWACTLYMAGKHCAEYSSIIMKVRWDLPAPVWFCQALGTLENHHGNVKFFVSEQMRKLIGYHYDNVITHSQFIGRLWKVMSFYTHWTKRNLFQYQPSWQRLGKNLCCLKDTQWNGPRSRRFWKNTSISTALSLVYSVEGNILQLATRNVDLSKPFSYLHLDQIVFVSNKHP